MDTLVQWDLTEPSEEPSIAGEYDDCLAFTDEETEAQRLGDVLKKTVLVFDTGDHAIVTFRLFCLYAAESKQPGNHSCEPPWPPGSVSKLKG